MKKTALVKKYNLAATVFIAMFLANCTVNTQSGFSKPTIFTNPVKYLSNYSLGNVSKSDLISGMGIPDKTVEFEGQSFYSYEFGEGYGRREFIYVVQGGVVVDVRYNDQGPYNGSSAKALQAK
jgi:hypothetical protein